MPAPTHSGPGRAHSTPARAPEGVASKPGGPRRAFEGVAVHASGGWETPLGTAPIDDELAAAPLAAEPLLFDDPAPHASEHSLEMQLPFLQRVMPGVRIVPLLMGTQSREETDALAGALSRAAKGRAVLLVASSDLSHYQPAPVASRPDSEVVEEAPPRRRGAHAPARDARQRRLRRRGRWWRC